MVTLIAIVTTLFVALLCLLTPTDDPQSGHTALSAADKLESAASALEVAEACFEEALSEGTRTREARARYGPHTTPRAARGEEN